MRRWIRGACVAGAGIVLAGVAVTPAVWGAGIDTSKIKMATAAAKKSTPDLPKKTKPAALPAASRALVVARIRELAGVKSATANPPVKVALSLQHMMARDPQGYSLGELRFALAGGDGSSDILYLEQPGALFKLFYFSLHVGGVYLVDCEVSTLQSSVTVGGSVNLDAHVQSNHVFIPFVAYESSMSFWVLKPEGADLYVGSCELIRVDD